MRERLRSIPGSSARRAWTLTACLLLVGAFYLDFASGSEVSSSLFYVLSISVGAWFVGRRTGVGLAVLSVIGWASAYVLVGQSFSKLAIFYWNMIADFAIYLVTAIAVARAREALDAQRSLARQLAESNRSLDRETRAVGELQRSMLPPALPSVPGYEWQVHYATSSRAGGDYYDFFALPNDRIGILLADASGHGPQAAVLVAMMRVLLLTSAETERAPECVLARLSEQLSRALPPGLFVTACYAVLEPASGRLRYSLAGHDPPLVLRTGSERIDRLPVLGGPPLGVAASLPFPGGTTELGPGDTLAVYTDGVTEALDPANEFFGLDGVCEALLESRAAALAPMRDHLLARLDAHLAGAPIADDVTVLLLRRSAFA